MLADLDLQALARMDGPERAFLSIYLSSPEAIGSLEHRFKTIRALLADEPEELEHFEENLKLAEPLWADFPNDAEGLCLFVCWANDMATSLALPVAPPDKVWVGSAPFIRPLAELKDEHEDFAVVVMDNSAARLFLVADAEPAQEGRVRGGVKNRVKVGGWSQKRYARRREKALDQYAQGVLEQLVELAEGAPFSRLVLLGSDEAVRALESLLPRSLSDRLVGTESVSLDDADAEILRTAFLLAQDGEEADEQRLWSSIREGLFTEGLATAGPSRVLKALAEARVEAVLLDREAVLEGVKCRACETVVYGTPQTCQRCGSADLFEVDIVEVIVERAAQTGADVDFTDPFEGLTEVGQVAALLRY